MQPQFRSSAREIGNLLVGTPDGQQIPLSQLANINQGNGASFIYRENNSRYIGVQYSIEGRDLERAVRDGQAAVNKAVKLPQGYRMLWGGEYSQFLEAKSQMYFIGPLAVVLIFMILLINKRELMNEWTNSRAFNMVSWATVVVMIGLTLAWVGITMRGMH